MQGDGLPFFEFCSAHFGGVTRDELLGLLGRMVWNRDFASVDAIVTEGVWKPALPTCARYGAVRRIVDLRLVNDSRTLANTVCQWVQQQLDMDGIVMDYLAFGWLLAEHMQ
jgi:hypothetical protein